MKWLTKIFIHIFFKKEKVTKNLFIYKIKTENKENALKVCECIECVYVYIIYSPNNFSFHISSYELGNYSTSLTKIFISFILNCNFSYTLIYILNKSSSLLIWKCSLIFKDFSASSLLPYFILYVYIYISFILFSLLSIC